MSAGAPTGRLVASVGERICGPGTAAGALLRKASVHTFENAPSASANVEAERTQEEGKGIRTPTWPWCLTCFAGAAKQVGTWLAFGEGKMNKQEQYDLDDKWASSRPILWKVCLAAIAISAIVISNDIQSYMKGIKIDWNRYGLAAAIVIGISIGNMIRTRKK